MLEEPSGRRVDPDTRVNSLSRATLTLREGFFADAVEQLKLFQAQSADLFDFEPLPEAPAISLELRHPGLVERVVQGQRRIFFRAHHQVLIVLPWSFPKRPPHLIWLSPVFHPALVPEELAWPPDFRWEESPSLLRLMGALVETLLGLRTSGWDLPRLLLRRHRNPRAARWFHKHRRALLRFGRTAGYPLATRLEGLPLSSPQSNWRLRGCLTGGNSMVFLSQRFNQAFLQLSQHGPGWLLGQGGQRGKTRWFYIDRFVPARRGSIPPDNAIGTMRAADGGWKFRAKELRWPLIVEARDGRPVFLAGPDSTGSSGCFVEAESPSASQRSVQSEDRSELPRIRVGPTRPYWTQRRESATIKPEPTPQEIHFPERLMQRSLEPPICAYCDAACLEDEDWGACSHCDTLVHTGCLHSLGGCPYTECPRGPLHVE